MSARCTGCGWAGQPADADRHLCAPSRTHGLAGTYSAGCRCADCRTAQARYAKRWKYDRAQGRTRLADSELLDRVRGHLDHLYGLDWTASAIGVHADVSRSTLVDLLRRRRRGTLTKKVTGRLLAVHPAHPGRRWDGTYLPDDDETFVPSIGARRRIEALHVAGWRHEDLRLHSGVRTAVLVNQAGRVITWRNHLRVARVYDELALQPGPSPRTRARALARGMMPALAWDDDMIDDPSAGPLLDALRA